MGTTISWDMLIQIISMVATAVSVWAALRTDLKLLINDHQHLAKDVGELKMKVEQHGDILATCKVRRTDER